jgi:hypothetical protein
MEDFDAMSEPRKEWAAPELKKIDIEEITKGFVSTPSSDGTTGFS